MVRKITITTTWDSRNDYISYIAVWHDDSGEKHTSDSYEKLCDVFSDVFFKFNPRDKFEISFQNNLNNTYHFNLIEYLAAKKSFLNESGNISEEFDYNEYLAAKKSFLHHDPSKTREEFDFSKYLVAKKSFLNNPINMLDRFDYDDYLSANPPKNNQ